MDAVRGITGPKPRVPVRGYGQRCFSIITKHWRGLVGFFIPFAWWWTFRKGGANTRLIWLTIIWYYLWQPVNVPVTGMMPIFLFPLCGVISTEVTAKSYFNDTIALFILGGMLFMLLNNSGADRRIALKFLCWGDACQFTSKWMIFKASAAAFLLSMFCNRLIVTSTITQYMTSSLIDLQAATSRSSEPDFDELRYIINSGIQTSAAIGSLAIITSAYTPMLMKAVFDESVVFPMPDVFNFLQYSAFAFPTACVMFLLNVFYHKFLVHWFILKSMTASSTARLKNYLLNHRKTIPHQPTCYELLTMIYTFIALVTFLLRWSPWLNMGWASYRQADSDSNIPVIRDATVAAFYVILFHALPKSVSFMRYAIADKKSELPPIKPESAVLWWRFVDKNTNYGYIFVLGSGVAIMRAAAASGFAEDFATMMNGFINLNWNTAVFILCFVSVFLCNIMTGAAACAVLLPVVMCMAMYSNSSDWSSNSHILALIVGLGTSFGFLVPFLFTPAYFCHYTGKVPRLKMAKYAWFSVFICLMVLYLMVLVWAPVIWKNGVSLAGAPEPEAGGGGGEAAAEAPAAAEAAEEPAAAEE